MFLKIPSEELALKLTLAWTAAAVPGIGLIGHKAYKAYKINKVYGPNNLQRTDSSETDRMVSPYRLTRY